MTSPPTEGMPTATDWIADCAQWVTHPCGGRNVLAMSPALMSNATTSAR